MKNRVRAFIATLSGLALALSLVTPGNAASVFITTIKMLDQDGHGVAKVGLLIQTQNAKGTNLEVFKTTDASGMASVQTYAGAFKLWIGPSEGDQLCLRSQVITGTLTAAAPSIEVRTPNVEAYTFQVADASGKPVPQLQVDLRAAVFDDGFSCEPTSKRTDERGQATLISFTNPVWRETDRAAIVYYQPFEGAMLRSYLSEGEVSSKTVSVVLDDIPSTSVTIPAGVRSGAAFSVSGSVLDPSGQIATSAYSSASGYSTVSVKARTQFKKLELWASTAKGSKWNAWKKVATASVGLNGKYAFTKIKQSVTTRYQVRGLNFALANETKVVLTKK